MKIKNDRLRNPAFANALRKLANFGGFTDYKQIYNVKEICRQFEKVSETLQAKWDVIVEEFADKNEEGVIKTDPQDPNRFLVKEEKKSEWKKTVDEFKNEETTLVAETIQYESVKAANLSPIDIMQLEDIVMPPKEWMDAMAYQEKLKEASA